MRLVHAVRSDAFAGVERYLTYVAPELVRRGHEVLVVGGDPDRMAAALDPSGVAHRPAATTGEVARSLWRDADADLVHAHMTAAELGATLAWPRHRRPIVTTLHFAGPRGRSGLRAVAYRALQPVFAREIAISEFVARTAGGDPEVIPNGVPDLAATGGGAGAPGAARTRTVLVGQRLEREKDTLTAVAAWSRCGLGDRGWALEIAGSGAQRAEVEAAVRSSPAGSSVRLLGQVDDLADRMGRAGIFLATAPAEPFGLSVAEAMAAGAPVVAADGGGHRELLRHSGADQLVAPEDPVALAERLRELAGDDARRMRLGAANRARYEADYTLEHHVDRLEALYDDVLATRGAR